MKKDKAINKKQELINKSKQIQEKLYNLKVEERVKDNTPLVGKYFKFNNGSSGRRWWLYGYVIKLDPNGFPIMNTVEVYNQEKEINLKVKKNFWCSFIVAWKISSKKEYDNCYKKAKILLEGLV